MYKAYFYYPYMTETHEISMQSEFDGSYWLTIPNGVDISEDWNALYGMWRGVNSDNRSKQYLNLDIHSVDVEKSIINYSYEYYTYNGYGSGSINLHTGNITTELKTTTDSDYDYETEFKYENCPEVTIYIGKNTGIRAHASDVSDYIMSKE